MPQQPHRRRAGGFTLIELLATLVVACILLGTAVPSFVATVARSRLEGVSNELSVDLQLARSEAIRRRTTATLSVDAGGSFYTVSYLNPSSGATVTLKTATMPSGVSLTGSAPVVFDALRGMANASTMNLSSSQTGALLRVSTNAIGRVQMCSPSGGFSGYTSC
jgi:type IV fimbrial biogenesis protein FimT